MYTLYGACSGLFHLAVRNPLLVLAFTFAGLVTQIQHGPPGQLMGTEAVMVSMQEHLVEKYPWLPKQVESLRTEFDKMNPIPTEEQVRRVLSFLEPCTDESVRDVLSNPDKRREAAWLLYLDTYAREGPKNAAMLFTKTPLRR